MAEKTKVSRNREDTKPETMRGLNGFIETLTQDKINNLAKGWEEYVFNKDELTQIKRRFSRVEITPLVEGSTPWAWKIVLDLPCKEAKAVARKVDCRELSSLYEKNDLCGITRDEEDAIVSYLVGQDAATAAEDLGTDIPGYFKTLIQGVKKLKGVK